MAILLYKAGNTHVVRGVECEIGRFDVSELSNALALGWQKDPHETLDEQPVESNDDVVSLDESDLDTLKEYAQSIGVKYAPNIGEAKLREKVREALEGV